MSGLAEDQSFGVFLLSAITFSTDWMHRKVDSVRLADGASSVRRVSLDVTVPSSDLETPSGPHAGLLFVPLSVVAKRPLKNFDATIDAGTPVPVADRVLNHWAVCQAIFFALEISLGKFPSKRLQRVIDEIVDAPPSEELTDAIEDLLSTGQWRSGSTRVVDPARLTLSNKNLIRDFASNFLLAVLLPPERAGSRAVLKYRYHWDFVTESAVHGRSLRDRAVGRVERMAAPFGIVPYAVTLPVGTLQVAPASFHFEVHAPSGLAITSLDPDQTSGTAVDVDPAVAHLVARPERVDRLPEAVSVQFQHSRGGQWRSAAIATGLSCLFFWLVFSVPGIAETMTDKDNRAAASFFLAFPALLIALSARSIENPLVSSLANPLRAITFLLALSFFASGFVVLSGGQAAAISGLAVGAAVFSSVSLLLFSFGWLFGSRSAA